MKLLRIRKLVFSTELNLLILAIVLFGMAGTLNNSFKKPPLKLSKQETAINVNKNLLVFLSAGNKRLITDLLWVQTLLESDLEHYKSDDFNNWMYIRFLTISHLDPHFYENYLYGGQYLSIVKDDLNGAIDIFQRGIKYYPDDYALRFHLGFAYFFEKNNYKEGVKWLEQIMFHKKAPPFLKVIVNKMKFELKNDFDYALLFTQDILSRTKDLALKEKLKKDFYALKAERDLRCLNYKGTNCEFTDADNNRYLFLNGRYHSQKKFVPYRLKKKGDQSAPNPVDTI